MSAKNITILYVEDDENIRLNTKRPLQYLSNKLFLASNGLEGLKIYKKEKIDIVISDIKMPKMNGIEMAKEIKKINPDQYIIFITAHSDTNFFLEAIDLQVDGYILKPIDYNLLKNKVFKISEQIKLKTKLKQQQKKIYKQQLQLIEQAKDIQIKELLTNIAHQWRQPLSVISTSATGILVQKEYGLLKDNELIEACKNINENAQFLSKTIDLFKKFNASDEEKQEIILQDSVNFALDIEKESFKQNNIQIINLTNEKEPIKIVLTSSKLSQVLLNILKNSIEVLNKKEYSDRWIKINAKKEDKCVIVSIEDNGGGIPKDIMPKIFDPYFTTKHQSRGTGLGLYMTKKIIEESFNGVIKVLNTQNGAKFIVMLPI